MVRTVSIECTQCCQVSDLHLSSDARIIIFNCPACWTPILYFNRRSYTLTEKQIGEIIDASRSSSITKILQRIVRKVPEEHAALIQRAPAMSMAAPAHTAHRERVCRRQAIDGDDVLNLHFELERCTDSGEFLGKI